MVRLERLGFAVTLLGGIVSPATSLVPTGADVVALRTTTVARFAGAVPTLVGIGTAVTRCISALSCRVSPLGTGITSRACRIAFVAGEIPSCIGFTHGAAPSLRRPSGVASGPVSHVDVARQS